MHEKGPFEQKQCFAGVKYNGKGKWDPPTERLTTGLWDLSTMEPDKKGEMTLTFNFALDPHSYKAEMSKINKMLTAAAESGKPITNPAQMKPKPKEFISVKTMSREEAPATQFERVV